MFYISCAEGEGRKKEGEVAEDSGYHDTGPMPPTGKSHHTEANPKLSLQFSAEKLAKLMASSIFQ